MIGEYPGDRSGAYTAIPTSILSGTPTLSVVSGTSFWHRTDAGGPVRLTLHMAAGDSIVWASQEDWQWGEPVDAALARGYWILATVGAGTLEVADAYDLGYNFPTLPGSFTVRPLLGQSGGFSFYELDPAMLDASHLYNDGEPLVRLTCTAGTIDVTFLGNQIEQTAGYFEQTGFIWSGTQGAGFRYLAPVSGDPTWQEDGFGNWMIDGTPVLRFPDFAGPEPNFGRKNGAGFSETGVDEAITLRDASYALQHGGVYGRQAVTTSYSDGVGVIGAHESWTAAIDETPNTTYTVPTKSALPSIPPTMPTADYLATGEFEWLDADSGFRGYRLNPQVDGLYYEGDAGTARLLANFFNTSPDPMSVDYYSGTLIVSLTKTTNDNLWDGTLDPAGGGPVTADIPLTDIETTDNFMVLSCDTTVRTLHTLVHTGMPSGLGSPQSITASRLQFFVPVSYKYRVPTYRYKIPVFTQVPFPGVVSWVRNVQRNDGLGISNWRWNSNVKVQLRIVGFTFSGFGSNQSIRWRAIR